jgi:hypothetical protein
LFIALDFPVPWDLGKGDFVVVVVVVVVVVADVISNKSLTHLSYLIADSLSSY